MDGRGEGCPLLASTTTVDLSQNGEAMTDLTGKVHQLPCCIKYDGPTYVSHYFKPKPSGMEMDGLRVEEAYFRGRKLHGTTVSPPLGYSGFILGKKSPDEKANISSSICWKTCATFENVTIWNHDAIPSKDDAFLRALHWFPVAKANPNGQIIIPPQGLNIVWGGDSRYWNIPDNDSADKAAELKQVCWLEVTGSVNETNPKKNYEVGFIVSLAPDAFGWDTFPIYIMVKRGKDGKSGWTKVVLNPNVTHRFEITGKLISNSAAQASNDKKLYFGLYEVWSGKWKGGLRIHKAFVREIP